MRGAPAASLPLVETHLHLEGSIPRRVLAPLAARAGRPLAPRVRRSGAALQRRRGFAAFLDAFVFCASLLRDRRDVEEAAGALLEDLRSEGIEWAEITFSPQVYLRRGIPLNEVLEGLSRARARARRGGGPGCGFIADGARLWGASWLEGIVEQILAFRDEGVVAIGLGGEETAAPARSFRRAIDQARRGGLGVVAHAGEGTTPRAVREVIDHLRPSRIAHGIAAAGDRALLDRIARRGIVLEVCPTSNVWTGAVRSIARHPIGRLLEAGVRVAIGSDDRTVFGTTLRSELRAVVEVTGVPEASIPDLMLNAVDGSFAPEALKRDLRRRIRREIGREAGGDETGGRSRRAAG